MKRQNMIVIGVVVMLVIGVVLFSFYSGNGVKPDEDDETEIVIHNKVELANPSTGYCLALGYELRPEGQRGFCVFPDENECGDWAFYRGECGQEWSYCKLKGYDLKLNQPTGAIKGVICIDKNTGEELGTVFDLVNAEFISQNK